jgi:hypothetical protein
MLFLPFAEKVSGLIRDQMPAGRASAAKPTASLRYPRDGAGSVWRACADEDRRPWAAKSPWAAASRP